MKDNQLIVNYESGSRFSVTDGEYTLVAGEGDDEEGRDNMSPGKTFVAAVGMCVGTYAVKFCKRHEISTEDLKVKVDYENAQRPARVGKINLEVELAEELDERMEKGLLKMADQCYVKQSIQHGVEFDLSLNSA